MLPHMFTNVATKFRLMMSYFFPDNNSATIMSSSGTVVGTSLSGHNYVGGEHFIAYASTNMDTTQSIYGQTTHKSFQMGDMPSGFTKFKIIVQSAGGYGPRDDGDGATPSNDGDMYYFECDKATYDANIKRKFLHISLGSVAYQNTAYQYPPMAIINPNYPNYSSYSSGSLSTSLAPYEIFNYGGVDTVASTTITQSTYGGMASTDSFIWLSDESDYTKQIESTRELLAVVRGGAGSTNYDRGTPQPNGWASSAFGTYSYYKSRQNGGNINGRGSHGSVDSHFVYNTDSRRTTCESEIGLTIGGTFTTNAGAGGGISNQGGPSIAIFWFGN